MKRSEMTTKMYKYYEDHYEDSSNYDVFLKGLLTMLEQEGMLPPERVYWNRRPDGALLPSPKNGNMIREWDKE